MPARMLRPSGGPAGVDSQDTTQEESSRMPVASSQTSQPAPTGTPLRNGCRVGLALSGGAARSIAHIGILKALRQGGVPVDVVAGTSGGAVIGLLYAAGLSVDEMERVALTLRWRDLAGISLSRMGLISIKPLQRLLQSLVGPVRLESLPVALAVVATNLVRRERHVFRTGDAIQAVLASSAMPHVYRPLDIDGDLYSDGGIVEYLPMSALEAYRPLVRVGVHLLPEDQYRSRPRHLGQVMATIVNIIQRANALTSSEEADVLIKPAVAPFPPFDLVNAAALVEAGYNAGKRHVPKILDLLHEREKWLGELGPRPPSRSTPPR